MKNIHQYWVYVMANGWRNVIYIGVTNNLYIRYLQHKTGVVEGFTKKYKCHHLIYYEEYTYIEDAIRREKELKGWRREKKMRLIRQQNPLLKNLAAELGWNEIPPSSE